jgi:sugar/nucleoside kinase (ribokinase family)
MVADLVVSPVAPDCFQSDTSRLECAILRSGGDALNEATVLARLGVRTAVLGRVGQDLFGNFLLEELGLAGVDTQHVRRDATVGTALTVVLLQSNSERNFLYYPGATANLVAEDVSNEILSECQMLVVGSAFGLPSLDGEGLAGVLARARSMGVTTALDTTWDTFGRWLPTLQPVLPHVNFFMPSVYEARALVGDGDPEEVAARLAALGPSVVVIKLGAAGCYLHTAERGWHIPPLPSHVVDTTGAGDCFVGGFLAGWIRGWDLFESARLGHAAAACCVEEVGATTGVHSWEQVYARFQAG